MARSRLLVPFVIAALGATLGCKPASGTALPDPERGLTVTGVGDANGVPDEASVQLGVQARASDAAGATAAASATVKRVIAALVREGVERSAIQTRQVTVYEDRRYEPPRPMEAEPEGGARSSRAYVASNMLEVQIRDLDAIGEILAAASKAGVNQMHGIQMKLADPTALEQAALDSAFAAARSKAEHLARQSGVKLGPIVAIRVGEQGGSVRPVHVASRSMAESDDASVAVERGEIEVRQHVWVKYAIEQ